MKTKNVAFGIAALVFALSSAFASILPSPVTANKVFINGCRNITPRSCDTNSQLEFVCQVNIDGTNYSAYQTCSTTLYTSSADIPTAEIVP